jgi:hypothetical protein
MGLVLRHLQHLTSSSKKEVGGSFDRILTGYSVGMPGRQPLSSPPEVLAPAIRQLIAKGLPITEATADMVLPNQRCIYALAQHPDELASRVTTTNRLLGDLLNELGPSARGTAARTLFGLGRPLRGTNLTHRRGVAAGIMERHEDHFRKHIEPKLIQELAFAIHQQNLRYTPKSAKARPAIGSHEDTPAPLSDESLTEQEELLCRVWSAVYGYRAEMVAVQRRLNEAREGERPPDADLQEHLDSATWQLARLLTFVSAYLEHYGETILLGEVPFSVEGLVQLAGWSGGLGTDEAKRLRFELAKVGVDDRAGFVAGISA